MKTLTLFLILLCIVANIFGQASPTAEKIDEFGRLGCCDFDARIDNLFFRLEGQPNASGYVVIAGNTLFERIYLERYVLDLIAHRYSARKKITIVRAKGHDAGPELELWMVPDGAEKPQFQEIILDFTLPPDRKPFLFADNTDPGICPVYSLDLGHLSEFLGANPTARGNIVISSRVNAKESRELRSKLLDNARAVNIPVEKLRFFRGETRYNSTVEVWVVPGRSRR